MSAAVHRIESKITISYERHGPEKTLLYQTIQKYLATFLEQCEAEGKPVPAFVKKEFNAYLECGILAHGFARIYCAGCRYDRLVAFSCKRRGFCGSCMVRRMNETAAQLVDLVIPQIPSCQWVLSLPAPLRFLVSYDSKALIVIVDAFSKIVFSWLRRKAKERGITQQASESYPGAITFIQRFGSALNLNCHLHSIFSAGVYTEDKAGELSFHQLPGPDLQEAHEITAKIAKRVHKWLAVRMQELEQNNDFADKEPLLASCYAASIRYLSALGHKAGQPLMKVLSETPKVGNAREERTVAGFNLHVSLPIGAHDRAGLERQLRYMGRPPLSEERLTLASNGNLVVKLKTAWKNGTSHIVMTPMEFMERLVALIPPPRKNQIRYHGVFAPNARLRPKVVPKKTENETKEGCCSSGPKKGWARMMARVFAIDVLKCPRCDSKMQTISFITESKVIKEILSSIGMATAPPQIAKAADTQEQRELSYDYA